MQSNVKGSNTSSTRFSIYQNLLLSLTRHVVRQQYAPFP